MNKKRVILLCSMLLVGSLLSAAAQQEMNSLPNPELVPVNHGLGETLVPENPSRVLVFDLGTLDILDSIGVEIIGLGRGATLPSYLSQYADETQYPILGSLHEPDFEKVYDSNPDVILIGGRAAKAYEELSKIAPTVLMTLPGSDYMDTLSQNIEIIGTIFPEKREMLEEKEEALFDAIDPIEEYVEEREYTALFVMVNAGNLSVFGSGSRFSIIYDEFGFINVDESIMSSTHGQSSSFEYLLQQNPDYLFVLDRSAAIGADTNEGGAKAILDNDLVHGMDAWKQQKIIYVDPTSWYVASGGLKATQVMINDVKSGLDL